MINEIKQETETRMKKCLDSLASHLSKIRTGRAHPGVLDGVMVSYYGNDTPLSQLANINVEDGRTLTITAWEKNITPDIERAIIAANLGLNPMSAGTVIRVPMPSLTEETRKNFIKQAKNEAEGARVAVRGVRRDANTQLKDLLKSKDVSEDEERRAQDDVQKLTDRYIADVESVLAKKEKELMEF